MKKSWEAPEIIALNGYGTDHPAVPGIARSAAPTVALVVSYITAPLVFGEVASVVAPNIAPIRA